MLEVESKYFIDHSRYNCPFCKTRSVGYKIVGVANFDEKKDKKMQALFVECFQCGKVSLHLSKKPLVFTNDQNFRALTSHSYHEDCHHRLERSIDMLKDAENIDDQVVMHIPTSFFTIDERIPSKFRILINEAEKCISNNCLTGASACIRKIIYEFILDRKLKGNSYEEKIKSLKTEYSSLDDLWVTILCHIQGITSNQVHENPYKEFKIEDIKLYLEILKRIFNEIYVLPEERKSVSNKISQMYSDINKKNSAN